MRRQLVTATFAAAVLALGLSAAALANTDSPKTGLWLGASNGPKCITPQGRKPCQISYNVEPSGHHRVVSDLSFTPQGTCSDGSAGSAAYYGYKASETYRIASDGAFQGTGKDASVDISIKGIFTGAKAAHGTYEASWDEDIGGKKVACHSGTRKWTAQYKNGG